MCFVGFGLVWMRDNIEEAHKTSGLVPYVLDVVDDSWHIEFSFIINFEVEPNTMKMLLSWLYGSSIENKKKMCAGVSTAHRSWMMSLQSFS